MTDLSDFQRCQIVGARMAGVSVTKTAEMFGVSRSTASKVMTSFEKEGKTSCRNKTLEENQNFQIGTVELLRELLEKITKIQLPQLLQSLMTTSRTQFPQKLFAESRTKPDFMG